MRTPAAAALLLVALVAQAAEREPSPRRRDVTVYELGRQVESFDLPDGDDLCVMTHVSEEDPVAGTWHLSGEVEIRVSAAHRVAWRFVGHDLVLRKAGVDRLRQRAHAAPLAPRAPLPRCMAVTPPVSASAAD